MFNFPSRPWEAPRPVPSAVGRDSPVAATYALPLSGFSLVVTGDDPVRLEVWDRGGVLQSDFVDVAEPAAALGGGWRGGVDAQRWALAVGPDVPDLAYLTFLLGRRPRAGSRLSMAPTRIGAFWYVECAFDATRVEVVVAGRSGGVKPLRAWAPRR